MTTQKNGTSALGLQRVLGLKSYQTAWTGLHKFRRAMVRPGRDRLTGRVEVDECYVGGLEEGLPGGEPRELVKLSDFSFLGGWTPDGKSLLYSRNDTPGPKATFAGWILPVDGGEPRRLELGENFVSQLVMHPDGKQIAFWSNNQTGEQIWALENHLPILAAKK